jgi:hypothetical protein
LERQNNGSGAYNWLEEYRCPCRIVGFHAKEHKIGWRESAQIRTGMHRYGKISVHTPHRQAPFLQYLQMGATGHERDIRPTLG